MNPIHCGISVRIALLAAALAIGAPSGGEHSDTPDAHRATPWSNTDSIRYVEYVYTTLEDSGAAVIAIGPDDGGTRVEIVLRDLDVLAMAAHLDGMLVRRFDGWRTQGRQRIEVFATRCDSIGGCREESDADSVSRPIHYDALLALAATGVFAPDTTVTRLVWRKGNPAPLTATIVGGAATWRPLGTDSVRVVPLTISGGGPMLQITVALEPAPWIVSVAWPEVQWELRAISRPINRCTNTEICALLSRGATEP